VSNEINVRSVMSPVSRGARERIRRKSELWRSLSELEIKALPAAVAIVPPNLEHGFRRSVLSEWLGRIAAPVCDIFLGSAAQGSETCVVECMSDLDMLPIPPLCGLEISCASGVPIWTSESLDRLIAWTKRLQLITDSSLERISNDEGISLFIRHAARGAGPRHMAWSYRTCRDDGLRPCLFVDERAGVPPRLLTLGRQAEKADGWEACASELIQRLERAVPTSFVVEVIHSPSGMMVANLVSDTSCVAVDADSIHAACREAGDELRDLVRAVPAWEVMKSSYGSRLHGLQELFRGEPAGTRIVSGRLATRTDQIDTLASDGSAVILFRDKLPPSEAQLLTRVRGLVTRTDGHSSHATIMAHAAGVAVLSSARSIEIAPDEGTIKVAGSSYNFGEWVTIDETEGILYLGRTGTEEADHSKVSSLLASLANLTRVAVLANASNAEQVKTAKSAGARGIGLCRSENQLFEGPFAAELEEFILATEAGAMPPLPQRVCDKLQQELAVMLLECGGDVLHYRLIDANLDELASWGAAVHRPDRRETSMRGPRWALTSGFYQWQIEMSVRSIVQHCVSGEQTDVVIVVPSVSSVGEVRKCSEYLERALRANPVKIRLGCMVETPRAVELAGDIARLVDVVCIGLNDLTASTWGISRAGWEAVERRYRLHDLALENPFHTLDDKGVGRVLTRVIANVRAANPACLINICGEQTNDAHACMLLSELRPDSITCHARMISMATLGLAASDDSELRQVPRGLDCSMSAYTRQSLNQALAKVGAGDKSGAQRVACDWAHAIAMQLALGFDGNWKVFKRDMVAFFFGGPEARRFAKGWAAREVVEYVDTLRNAGKVARYSSFPEGISCHSISAAIESTASKNELLAMFGDMGNDSLMEVFPQQNADQLCFRLAYNARHALIEAGWGQAMYVFEAERGQHPIGRVVYDYKKRCWIQTIYTSVPHKIADGLEHLTEERGDWLIYSARRICAEIGIDWVAFEGYFNVAHSGRTVVVDVDLPLDLVWN